MYIYHNSWGVPLLYLSYMLLINFNPIWKYGFWANNNIDNVKATTKKTPFYYSFYYIFFIHLYPYTIYIINYITMYNIHIYIYTIYIYICIYYLYIHINILIVYVDKGTETSYTVVSSVCLKKNCLSQLWLIKLIRFFWIILDLLQ